MDGGLGNGYLCHPVGPASSRSVAHSSTRYGPSGALVDELETANATVGVSVFGGVLLVWGTLRIFRGLDTAFSDIYESGGENDLPDQILDGLVVLLTVVVGAVVETRLGGLSAVQAAGSHGDSSSSPDWRSWSCSAPSSTRF